MTIGVYNNHAFKDIKKLAHVYACGACNQQFTKVCNLQRHATTCSQGETVVVCLGNKVTKPQSAYEKTFYPKNNTSPVSLRWIAQQDLERVLHIHHAMCGGQRWIEGAQVDGYEPTTKTVFQFHGCKWHGCHRHCERDAAQRKQYASTRKRDQIIRDVGYNLVVHWECEWNRAARDIPRPPTPKPNFEPYPHDVVYDFEACFDKTTARQTPSGSLFRGHARADLSIGG